MTLVKRKQTKVSQEGLHAESLWMEVDQCAGHRVAPQLQEKKTAFPAWEEPGEGEYRCYSWVRPSWLSACRAKNSQHTLLRM